MIITSTRLRGGRYSGAITDPYFNLVTLLLPGNGANGAQNNTFLDSSTNNFAVTREGNTTQGSFSPFSPSGYSNYFDGTDTLFVSGAGESINFGTNDFTIEAWFNNSTLSTTFQIFDTCPLSVSSPTNRIIIRVNTSGALQYVTFQATTVLITSSNSAVTTGTWNHVALVKSSGSTKLYLNGTQVGSTYADSLNYPAQANRPMLMADSFNGTGLGTGYISNLRIVKGTAVYTSNFTPPTAPLSAIANTSLLTCQSNRFIDNSSNGFTLTINGTEVRPFSPFPQLNQYKTAVNGGSLYLDGSGDYLSIASAPAFQFGDSNFTVETWVYRTANAQVNIYSKRDNVATAYGSIVFVTTTGGNIDLLGTVNGSSWAVNMTSNARISANAWNHVAVTRNGSIWNTWVNGINSGNTDGQGGTIPDNSANVTVGSRGNVTGINQTPVYFSGFRVVKGTAVYTTNFTPPTSPLTAIANTSLLLNSTNAGIVDAAVKNNLETAGNASISTAQSKWGTSSIYFDGTGDWLLDSLGTNPDSQLRTGNFTIELWVYLASADVGSARGLVSKGTSTTGYSVSLNSTEKVVFSFTTSTITSTGSMPTDSWVHIAVVRSGTGANLTKIYINGVNDGTGTVSTDFSQTNNLYVGADRVAGSPMKGYIQDLRITRGLARYTANFTPPTQPFPIQ